MMSEEATSSPKADPVLIPEGPVTSAEEENAPTSDENAAVSKDLELLGAKTTKRGAKRTTQKPCPRPRKKVVAAFDECPTPLPASWLRCTTAVDTPWATLSGLLASTSGATGPPPPIHFPHLTDLGAASPGFPLGPYGMGLPGGLPGLPLLQPTSLDPASAFLDPKVLPAFPPLLPLAGDAIPGAPGTSLPGLLGGPASETEGAKEPAAGGGSPPAAPDLTIPNPAHPAAAPLLCATPPPLPVPPAVPLPGFPAFLDPALFGLPGFGAVPASPDLLPAAALLADTPTSSLAGPLEPVACQTSLHALHATQQKVLAHLKSLEEHLPSEGADPVEQQQQLIAARQSLQLSHILLPQLCSFPDDPLRMRQPRVLEPGDILDRYGSMWIGGKPTGIIQRKHSGWLVLFRSHSQRLRPDCPTKTFLDREIPGATMQEVQLESYQRALAWRNAVSSEKGLTKNEYCIIEHPDATKACRFLVVKASTKASGAPKVVKFVTDYKYRALVDRSVWTPKFNRGKVYITSRERTADVPNGKITHFAKAVMMEEGLPADDFEQKFVNGEPRDLRFQNLCVAGRQPLCHCWDPLHTRYTKALPFAPQPCLMEQGDACIHQTLSEFQWILDKSETIV